MFCAARGRHPAERTVASSPLSTRWPFPIWAKAAPWRRGATTGTSGQRPMPRDCDEKPVTYAPTRWAGMKSALHASSHRVNGKANVGVLLRRARVRTMSEQPRTSRSNSRQTPFVDLDTHACQACWKCADVCKQAVIGKVNFWFHKHAVFRQPGQCTGCLKCVKTCEHGAFTSRKKVAT
jgi:ferredoxin